MSTRVVEYFSIDEKTSHAKISELSIAYLLQFDDDSLPLTMAKLDSMPLASYAAWHWIDHAKSGRVNSTLLRLILCLFISGSAPLKNWIQMNNIDREWNPIEFVNRSMDRVKICSPLYYSSLAGMEEVLDCLLRKGENVNAEGGLHGNSLQAASYEGHETIVKLLLENGAEVNAKGGEYGDALQAASYVGNEAIVNTLSKGRAWPRWP